MCFTEEGAPWVNRWRPKVALLCEECSSFRCRRGSRNPRLVFKHFSGNKNKLSAARRRSRRSDFCDFTDFQGRRVYPNLRISTAAGVGQKPPRAMIGSVLIFKAAGVTKMYGYSKPPG